MIPGKWYESKQFNKTVLHLSDVDKVYKHFGNGLTGWKSKATYFFLTYITMVYYFC